MATTTVVTCDMHGDGTTQAEETVTFGAQGRQYELDLCAAHLAEFSGTLNRYIEAGAREVARGGRGGVARRARPGGRSRQDLSSVREWARNAGYEISTRGRIPAEILQAYGDKGRTTSGRRKR
jgi:hypothetical protein